MVDRQISISGLIRKLEARQTEKALKVVASGGTYESFLIGTGQFRETRGLIQYLENLIDKDEERRAPRGNASPSVPDDLDPDEPDEGEEEEEEEERPARAAPIARRTKPRAWGS